MLLRWPVDDEKRPPLRLTPFDKPLVWKKASSTPTLLSAASANVNWPAKCGSILALSVSSDSPRLKLRLPGPISSPPGTNPWIRNLVGSCDRLVYVPPRIADMAGLKALADPAAPAAPDSAAAGTAAAVA